MTDTLKPCPFCGNTWLRMLSEKKENLTWWFVQCETMSCGAVGPYDLGESGAVEAWNRRISDPPVQWLGIPEAKVKP